MARVSEGFLMKWHYITAILLIILLALHFAMRLPHYAKSLEFEVVLSQVLNVGWAIVLALLLVCATYHGLNGLRRIANEYFINDKIRKVVSYALLVIGIVIVLLGIYAIVYPYLAYT